MSSSAKCCPLAGWFLPLGTALQSLGLALMVGGMLALGAFTAPALFGGMPRNWAAPVMARIFQRYDIVLMAALVMAQVGEYLRWTSHRVAVKSRLNIVRLVLLGGLTLGIIYSTQFLNPQIEQMNQAGMHRHMDTPAGRQFDALHKRSENAYKLELLMAALLVLLTPFVRLVPVLPAEAPDATACETAEKPDCCS